ncbi:SMI1/KNR4 family protein [Pseudogracilibacillus auburnensis]|uniref:SMI1/KNR4 family protein n=1 Tax=Pseudogracilibacillus auburnensis TaxID=1494959 RepID=UPI001A9611D2|nr:SMI1/KNR4 family protein [Pseudogracilibacillus auburnensis]MBO1004900.1 SMI1/KNR4 family protein [Pseudogracilibacillus auburnensis]
MVEVVIRNLWLKKINKNHIDVITIINTHHAPDGSVKLPKDEITLNNLFAGDNFYANQIKLEYQQAVFSCLLSFTNKDATIIEVYDIASEYLLESIFPFAKDPFGNLICFDYRQDKNMPTILFMMTK